MLLHKEFGLNPTIPVCFWCGKDKNVIVLLGDTYKRRAPMNLLFDYEPCDACAEARKLGICLIEVVEKDNGKPEITKGMWPTGKWAVVEEKAIRTMVSDLELLARVIEKRAMLVPPEIMNWVFRSASSSTVETEHAEG